MLFNKRMLEDFIHSGCVKFADINRMDGVTLDLHYGQKFSVESPTFKAVNLSEGEQPDMVQMTVAKGQAFRLGPKQFCMAMTQEYFEMPNDATGLFFMKSKHGRAGLDHSAATIIKPGWSGHLVLEIINNLQSHTLMLKPGDPCGQVLFIHHEPTEPYAGGYNLQNCFGGSKP